MFLQPEGSTGHVVHFGLSEARNVDALFFMLAWAWYVFEKNRSGTHYTDLVFLNQVGYVGHVLCSVRPECEMSTHYFSCSRGPVAVSTKSALGQVTLNFCFCIW
jgi:hypothetical protein